MITVPSLDPCTDIENTDKVMITHANGTTETITGELLNKRNQVIISATATITGTPLKAGNVVRVLFTADQSANNGSTAMVINYNSSNKTVKVCKNGALADYYAFYVSTNVYKYCQAYTVLELLYDGTNFIIMGNPKVISNADYSIYADGSITYTNNIAVRKYIYTKYLKITFNTFISSSLGSVNILFGGRGATGLIVIGSSSYANFAVNKICTSLENYFVPNVYVKNLTGNHPIYIDVGGGLKANALILAQNVDIASIESVDTIPSDYINV